MKFLFLISLTYVAFVMETSAGTWALPGSTIPQFLFLTVGLGVLWFRGATPIVWAAVAGLLADVVGGSPVGLNVVLLANLAFIAQMAGARQSSESVFTSAAFVFLFVTGAGFASLTLQQILTGQSPGIQLIGFSSASRAGGATAVFLIAALGWAAIARGVRIMIPSRSVTSGRPKWAR
ncbi:MAG: rod shape-determining protein MreD [Planctomycetaceae bacterium]|nr:rod shape-determining protein MreD [Planctomycetaceae bacterium]